MLSGILRNIKIQPLNRQFRIGAPNNEFIMLFASKNFVNIIK